MNRREIKIEADYSGNEPQNTFYCKNEKGEWKVIGNTSELTNDYSNKRINECAKEIVKVINDTYSIRDRGVDIYFKGKEEDFSALEDAVEIEPCNITCSIIKNRLVAVAGKIKSGKTTLIKAFMKYKGIEFNCDNQFMYIDGENKTYWYEIPGIDYEEGSIAKAMNIVDLLESDVLDKLGITTLIYCLESTKIEKAEKDFLSYVEKKYPTTKILVVLTRFVDDEQTKFDELSQALHGIKIIPVLAMSFKTRTGTVHPYGLDDIEHNIFKENNT